MPTTNIRYSITGADKVKREMKSVGQAGGEVEQRLRSSSAGAKSLATSLDQTGEAARRTRKPVADVGSATRDLDSNFQQLRRTMATGLFALASREILQNADNYKLLQARLRVLTSETGDYAQVSQRVYQIAQQTGSALEDNVQVFQRLQLGARALGRSNQDVLALLKAVQQLGVIGGASTDQMKFGLLQFGQALSLSKLRAEEFNSLVENLPLVIERIEKGLGKAPGSLRAAVIEGKVLSRDVFEALLKQIGDIDDQFKNIPITLGRAGTIMANAMTQAFGNLDSRVGVTQDLSAAMVTLADNMDAVVGIGVPLVAGLTAIWAAQAIGTAATARLSAAKAALTAQLLANSAATQASALGQARAAAVADAAALQAARMNVAGATAALQVARAQDATSVAYGRTALAARTLVTATGELVVAQRAATASSAQLATMEARMTGLARAGRAMGGAFSSLLGVLGGWGGVAFLGITAVLYTAMTRTDAVADATKRYSDELRDLGFAADETAGKIADLNEEQRQNRLLALQGVEDQTRSDFTTGARRAGGILGDMDVRRNAGDGFVFGGPETGSVTPLSALEMQLQSVNRAAREAGSTAEETARALRQVFVEAGPSAVREQPELYESLKLQLAAMEKLAKIEKDRQDILAGKGAAGPGGGDDNPELAEKVRLLAEFNAQQQRDLELARMRTAARREQEAADRAEDQFVRVMEGTGKDKVAVNRDDPAVRARIEAVRALAVETVRAAEATQQLEDAEKDAAREADQAADRRDRAATKLQDLVTGLREQVEMEARLAALGPENARARAIEVQLIEARNLALDRGAPLTEDEIRNIQTYTGALYDLEEAQDKAREAAERAREALMRPMEEAADDIRRSFSDLWFGVFDDGKLKLGSFFKSMKASFARTLAEMMTMAITKPVIQPVIDGMARALGLPSAQLPQFGGGGGLLGGLVAAAPTLAGPTPSSTASWTGVAGTLKALGSNPNSIMDGLPVGFDSAGRLIYGNSIAGTGPGASAGLSGLLGMGQDSAAGKFFKDVFGKLDGTLGKLGTSIGGLAAGAGIGAMAGKITGSGTGGAIGGMIGQMFGPIGGIVGGLIGGLVGSLFKTTPRSIGTLSVEGGKLGVSDVFAKVLGPEVAEGMGGSVIKMLSSLADELRADLVDGFKLGQIGQRKDTFFFQEQVVDPKKAGKKRYKPQQFDSAEDAVTAAIESAITRGIFEGLTALDKAILEAAPNAIEGIQDVIAGRNFRDDIRIRLLEYDNPLSAQLERLRLQQEEELRMAKKYGQDMIALERLHYLERKQIVDQFNQQMLASMKDMLLSLTTTSAGGLAPIDVLSASEGRFMDLRARAMRGDRDAGQELAAAAGAFLEASRAVNASSAAYQDDLALVKSTLQLLTGSSSPLLATVPTFASSTVANDNATTSDLLREGASQTNILQGILDQLKKMNGFQVPSATGGGGVAGFAVPLPSYAQIGGLV